MGLVEQHDFSRSGQRLKVAIAGFGVEGKAILKYLQAQGGAMDITVLDQTEVSIPEGVNKEIGPLVFDGELAYDIVWRASPAIAPQRLQTSGQVMTMTQEFFARCPAPIIGVTGSKGKGTTSALCAEILKRAGAKVHLVGNIGRPALEALEQIKSDDIVVFELSSFQLWDLKVSPQVAVVLMIEPEHLDVHSDLNDYVQAKSNITRWQAPNDVTIYYPDNPLTAQAAEVGLGRKIKILTREGANIVDDKLVVDGQTICPTKEFGLLGEHNHANIAAALTAAWQFRQDVDAAATAIKAFKGLPHRLELISTKNGVGYIDDSISTTPSSALAAIKAFHQPKVIILGGSDKGSDYSALAQELADSDSVIKALLIGATTGKIRVELDKCGFKSYESLAGGMEVVVKRAAELAPKGSVVLLSPACASFDMFKDYLDRSAQFKAAVDKL